MYRLVGVFLAIVASTTAISGGVDTTIEEHPYQVAIYRLGSYYCGGAIVSESLVVTTANCVDDASESNLEIRVGSTIKSEGQIVNVAKINIHPERSFLDFNIAVLELVELLEFGETIQPIGLHDVTPPEAVSANVTGWGSTSSSSPVAETLQFLNVPLVDRDTCEELDDIYISSRMYCAGYVEGENEGQLGACSGDRGSPLVYDGKLLGLAAYTDGCGSSLVYGIYSYIPILDTFIRQFL